MIREVPFLLPPLSPLRDDYRKTENADECNASHTEKKYFEQKRRKHWKWSTPQFFQFETSVALHRALKHPIPILKQSYNDVQKMKGFFLADRACVTHPTRNSRRHNGGAQKNRKLPRPLRQRKSRHHNHDHSNSCPHNSDTTESRTPNRMREVLGGGGHQHQQKEGSSLHLNKQARMVVSIYLCCFFSQRCMQEVLYVFFSVCRNERTGLGMSREGEWWWRRGGTAGGSPLTSSERELYNASWARW